MCLIFHGLNECKISLFILLSLIQGTQTHTHIHKTRKLGLVLRGQNLLKQLLFSDELALKFNELVLLFVMT